MNLLIKYSVQQQIHFNGNVFGNKCCRCNEGSLYTWVQQNFRSDCANPRFFIWRILTGNGCIASLCGQWRLWSDFSYAQADLSLRWAIMSEGFLSCGSYVKLTLSAPKNWILKSIHPDETAHYNPSHLDIRCCESLLTSLMAMKCSSQSDLSDHDSEGQ